MAQTYVDVKERILESLDELVEVSPPFPDGQTGDRRVSKPNSATEPLCDGADDNTDDEEPELFETEEWTLGEQLDRVQDHPLSNSMDLEQAAQHQAPSSKRPLPHLDVSNLEPSTLNLSPGWFPTGMEYVSI